MKGKYRVIVKNNKLHYELEVKRNITIIKGNSATGKTTLVNMIRQFANFGLSSGIEVVSDAPCRILEGPDWQLILKNISGHILFIDEENGFIRSEAFVAAVRESDNYFVLITRENLYNLPYSVEEIYGIHSSGKYQNTKRVYQQMYRIYSEVEQFPIEPKCIVMEDSNSGYDFFKTVSEDKNIKCISAGGKTKLFAVSDDLSEETCIIADGAAIGAEMEKLFDLAAKRKNIKLYLPESFEWIILNSGLLQDKEIQAVLEDPENYIESQEYFSWERFFTGLLVHKTEDTYLKYQKSRLNPTYLHEKNKNSILNSIHGIKLN